MFKKSNEIANVPDLSRREGESGIALVLALLLVFAMAGFVVFATSTYEGEVASQKARGAAWHLVTLSQAAYVHVRENSLDPARFSGDNNGDGVQDTQYHKSNLVAPVTIPFVELQNAGRLPPGFPDTNALGQQARVVASRYPFGGDIALESTTSVSYVFLDNRTGNPIEAREMQELAAEARNLGMSVEAPFVDAGGLASDCDGDLVNDAAIWDTGCHTVTEFASLTGNAYAPGMLLVPAWRSVYIDARTLNRFPRPGTSGKSIMMADLEMGNAQRNPDGSCVAPFIDYHIEGDNTFTPVPIETLCQVDPDNGSDNRVDLINVQRFEARRWLLEDQGGAELRTELAGGGVVNTYTDEVGPLPYTTPPPSQINPVLSVSGRFNVVGATHVTGRIPNPTRGTPGFVPSANFERLTPDVSRLNVSRNVVVSSGGAVPGGASMEVIGELQIHTINVTGTP